MTAARLHERVAVATTLDVADGDRDRFASALAAHALPVWRAAQEAGIVACALPFVHERLPADGAERDVSWNAHILVVLAEGATRDAYAPTQEAVGAALRESCGAAVVRRHEAVRLQPEITLFFPRIAGLARERALVNEIEYVTSDPATRARYYRSQYRISGPAMRDLWRTGLLGRFVGYESVAAPSDGPADWDLVHLFAFGRRRRRLGLALWKLPFWFRARRAGYRSAQELFDEWEGQRALRVALARQLHEATLPPPAADALLTHVEDPRGRR